MKGVQNAQVQGSQAKPTSTLDTRDAHWSLMAEGGGMNRDGLVII